MGLKGKVWLFNRGEFQKQDVNKEKLRIALKGFTRSFVNDADHLDYLIVRANPAGFTKTNKFFL